MTRIVPILPMLLILSAAAATQDTAPAPPIRRPPSTTWQGDVSWFSEGTRLMIFWWAKAWWGQVALADSAGGSVA